MAVDAFIPEVWAAQLLTSLKKTLVYGQAGVVNRNYEGDISQYGDTVHISAVGPVSVRTYTAHSDITVDQVNDSDQTLMIDQSPYFAFEVDDIEARQARNGGAVMSESADEAAYSLGDTADQYLAGVMKSGVAASNQIGTVGTDASDGDASGDALIQLLIDMKVRLDEENIPNAGRWVIVNPAAHGKLLSTPQFVRVDQSGTSEALRNGQIGRAFGFDIMLSNNVPATSGTTLSSYTAIGGYSGATSYAEQINNVEAFRMERRFADGLKGLHLYGSKVVRPTGLVTAEVWL